MRGNVAWLTVCFLGTLGLNYAQLIAPVTDSLLGEPGRDFPIHAEIPKTSFSCQNQPFPGYYADVGSGCQAYHLCGDDGNQTSFLCPNGTIFNQATQTCDNWYNVDCGKSPQLFWRNKYFNAESKSGESMKKSDMIVGDDENTNGLAGNNSSSKVLSENDDLLKWKKIQDLIDSEIRKVLYRKQFENLNSNSSPVVETSYRNLREALSNGNSTQFKESLDGVISSRIDALSGSIKLNNAGKDTAPINEQQSKQMAAQKKAKAAEKIFTLLNYIDKIKTTLTSPKSSKIGLSVGKTKSDILPRFGEKLFKMISTLEKKQSMSTNTGINDSPNSRFNIADNVDFFDDYKYFVNKKEINKEDRLNVSINENMTHSLNASTFDKNSNDSMKTELDFLNNESSIAMIQRILDIAKQNLPSTTGAKVDDISKSVETSPVQDIPGTNVSSMVNDSTHGNHSYHKSINDIINSIEIGENNSKSPSDEINSTKKLDNATITSHDSGEISSSIHDSGDNLSLINASGDTSSSINDSGEISSPIHDSGDNSSSVNDSGEISSSIHDYGEISSLINDSGENSSSTNDYGKISSLVNDSGDNSSSINDSGDNSSLINDSGETTSSINDSGETSSTINDSGETSSSINDSGEISSSINDSGETLSSINESGEISSSVNDSGEISSSENAYEDDVSESYDYDEYSDEYDDDVSNKTNTSVENESNVDSSQENMTNVEAFGENVNNTKSDDENVSTVEAIDQNISNAENEEDLPTTDSFDSNLSSGDGIDDNSNQNSTVAEDVSNEGNINDTMGENNNNSSTTSSGLGREGPDAVSDTSEGSVNNTETVMTGDDDDDSEEGNDELLGILKGIYSTIDTNKLYRLRR